MVETRRRRVSGARRPRGTGGHNLVLSEVGGTIGGVMTQVAGTRDLKRRLASGSRGVWQLKGQCLEGSTVGKGKGES